MLSYSIVLLYCSRRVASPSVTLLRAPYGVAPRVGTRVLCAREVRFLSLWLYQTCTILIVRQYNEPVASA